VLQQRLTDTKADDGRAERHGGDKITLLDELHYRRLPIAARSYSPRPAQPRFCKGAFSWFDGLIIEKPIGLESTIQVIRACGPAGETITCFIMGLLS
jgi:hypothetical protein